MSILGPETGQSRNHKNQEDKHVLLDTISATFYLSAWQMFQIMTTLCLICILHNETYSFKDARSVSLYPYNRS